MDILEEAHAILSSAKYQTRRSETSASLMYFEDHTLYGFVSVCQNLQMIIENWESSQDAFLATYAECFRNAPRKSWNAYSIFLTAEKCLSDADRVEVRKIEEDFRSTRKIVGCGLNSQSDIKRALLPLLPVTNIVPLAPEDLIKRLKERLSMLSDTQAAALLNNSEAEYLVSLLLEEGQQ